MPTTILINKANFIGVQMNVKSFDRKSNSDFAALGLRENKANSKPNFPEFTLF